MIEIIPETTHCQFFSVGRNTQTIIFNIVSIAFRKRESYDNNLLFPSRLIDVLLSLLTTTKSIICIFLIKYWTLNHFECAQFQCFLIIGVGGMYDINSKCVNFAYPYYVVMSTTYATFCVYFKECIGIDMPEWKLILETRLSVLNQND